MRMLEVVLRRADDFGIIAHLVSLPLVNVKPFHQLSRFRPSHLKESYGSCQGLKCDCQEVNTDVCEILGIAPGLAGRWSGRGKYRPQQTFVETDCYCGPFCYSF